MEQFVAPARRRGVAALAALMMLGSLLVVVAAQTPAAAFGTSEPAPLPSVSAGGYMSCGVQTDGTAACWGENGVPTNDVTNVHPGGAATVPAGVKFLEVTAGYATACGVKTDQTLICWGSHRFQKADVPAGTFKHVVPGLNYVCGLRTDDTITCWGGDDISVDPAQKVIRDVPSGQFTQLTVGIRHACALRADGSIRCWGHNSGTNGAEGQTNVPGGNDTPGLYTHVDTGNFTPCAIKIDGTPVCWGRNTFAQQTYPKDASGNVLTFTKLSSGNAHVCGLRSDKSVVCWGRNFEGQGSPVPSGAFTQVTAGTFHSCGMREGDSRAVCWGNNAAGRVQPNMTNVQPHEAYVGVDYTMQFTMNPSPNPGGIGATAAAVTGISPTPSFTLLEGEVPPGLSLDATGNLSGTPTTAGSYPIKLAASNGLSPADCAVPVTLAAPNDRQSMPCVPGDTASVATATRAFTINVGTDVPAPGAITGQVTKSTDGTPVAGATVSLAYSDRTPAGETTTDGAGTYSFADVGPGSYTVTPTAGGYRSQAASSATVNSEQTTTVNLSLTPLSPPQIVGVWNNHWQTVTDGVLVEWNEQFDVLAQVGPGYTVHAANDTECSGPAIATGFRSNWIPENPNTTTPRTPSRIRDVEMTGYQNVTPGGSYRLRVEANTEIGQSSLQRNTLACAPFVAQLRSMDQGAITGKVTDEANAPVAGATVTVNRTIGQPGTVIGQATTDASGVYSVSKLPPSNHSVYGYNSPYQVVVSAPGYTPRTGSATTTFSAGNTTTAPSTSTATLNVTLANNAPNAVADQHTTNEDTALAADVLANDTDAEGDTLTATLGTGPAHGTLTLIADGSFTYTPAANYNGPDGFTYTASDSLGASSTATVAITVNPVNDAPVAANDAYTATRNVALNVAAPGVLGNDSDMEADTLTAAVVTGPANGTLTLNPNGSFAYTPKGGFSGTDSFTYRATDSAGASSAPATATITVVASSAASADLSVATADSPDPAAKGGTVTYAVTVANAGPSQATSVTVTAALKGGTLRTVATSQGTCSKTTCSLGTIAAGGPATVTVTATAPTKAGTMSLTAKASSPTPDPNTANNTKTESTSIA